MKNKIFLFLLILFGLTFWMGASAASIYSVSSQTQINENQNFSVTFYANTNSIYINNVEASIKFPNDLLSVESINTNGSIFTMWVEQPKFSNEAGTISFNGGIPNPGYLGSNGKIFSVIFRAKKVGDANISFSSANIYANDGLGTDVTTGKTGVSVKITPYEGAKTKEEIIVSDNLPTSPIIYSDDIKDEESWYSLKSARFYWDVPQNVKLMQILFDNKPTSTPTIVYNPPIKEKEIKDLKDGVFYLHLRFKNDAGYSKTSHKKIKIDTSAPTTPLVSYKITEDDQVSLFVKSSDQTSGIGKYKISVDGSVVLETNTDKNESNFILPSLSQGDHEVSVIVYDKAGNLNEKVATVNFPEIKSPEIISYSKEITRGEKFTIEGKTYKDADVRIWTQFGSDDLESYVVRSDSLGNFSFASDYTSRSGMISFFAEVIRGELVKSSPSSKYFVVINKTPFVKTSLLTMETLVLVTPILLLIIILIYLSLHAYYRLRRLRRRLMVDIEETESEVHKIFRIMKEDAKNIMEIFERKVIKSKLTDEEKEAIELLSKDIKEGEEYFEKRLEKIEKKDLF